jgi:ribosomal-protein-alanine N-acetyltransferase
MFLALHKINPKGFYVVRFHEQIVAYAIVLLEPYIDGTALRKRGHLINLAVAPEFRKQNIATFLIGRIHDDLRRQKANMILLEVRRSNKIALSFYSKLMFKRIGSIKGFYRYEDAIVMSKDI